MRKAVTSPESRLVRTKAVHALRRRPGRITPELTWAAAPSEHGTAPRTPGRCARRSHRSFVQTERVDVLDSGVRQVAFVVLIVVVVIVIVIVIVVVIVVVIDEAAAGFVVR